MSEALGWSRAPEVDAEDCRGARWEGCPGSLPLELMTSAEDCLPGISAL